MRVYLNKGSLKWIVFIAKTKTKLKVEKKNKKKLFVFVYSLFIFISFIQMCLLFLRFVYSICFRKKNNCIFFMTQVSFLCYLKFLNFNVIKIDVWTFWYKKLDNFERMQFLIFLCLYLVRCLNVFILSKSARLAQLRNLH